VTGARLSLAWWACLAVGLAAPADAVGQALIEARIADPEYRFLDLGYTTRAGIIAELFYVGVPGSNEVNLGGGYAIRRGGLTLTLLAYGVAGFEGAQRGVKLALLVSVERGGWKMISFLGRYLPVEGEVDDYLVLDALDLTRSLGARVELGIQAGFFRTGGRWNEQVGPLLKVNDRRGAWSVSYRFGQADEVRLGRVVVF
jgi:hypothetical protein